MSGSTGCMAELNVGIFLGCLCHEGLVAEGVCKDYIAAAVSKVKSCFIAFVAFGNVGFHKNLIFGKTKVCASGFCSVDEVFVIGGVFVVKENKTDFEVFKTFFFLGVGIAVRAAGEKGEHHDCCENKRNNLFHFVVPPFYICFSLIIFLFIKKHRNYADLSALFSESDFSGFGVKLVNNCKRFKMNTFASD